MHLQKRNYKQSFKSYYFNKNEKTTKNNRNNNTPTTLPINPERVRYIFAEFNWCGVEYMCRCDNE